MAKQILDTESVKYIYTNPDIYTNPRLARKFNVTLQTIWNIQNDKTRTSITKELEKGKVIVGYGNITQDEAKEIYENKDRLTYKELAKRYGISCTSVKNIHTRKRWSNHTVGLTRIKPPHASRKT